jgi:transcriptional regulator with PAS, ATPase and Fis domain
VETRSPIIQTAENKIPPFFNKVYKRSLKKLNIPCSDANLRQVNIISNLHSNFFQTIGYYNHNNFEIDILIDAFNETPPSKLETLSVEQVEKVFVQLAALFNLAGEMDLDFIDFSRFQLQPDYTIKLPIRLEGKGEIEPDHMLHHFKKNSHFNDLNEKNYRDLFERLSGKYKFNRHQAYIYRYDGFASTILNAYPIEELKNESNIKIRIKTADPIQEKIIKLNLYKKYISNDIFFIDAADFSENLPRFFAELIPGKPQYNPDDLVKLINQLNLYLKKSAFKALVLVIDHLKTKEDAEFINYLLHSSEISNIVLIVFHSAHDFIEYDLELKENPKNLLEDYLTFDKPGENLHLGEEEIQCLKIIKTLPFPISGEKSSIKRIFSHHQTPIVENLIRENVLKVSAGRLVIHPNLPALNPGIEIKPTDDEETKILESYLGTFDSLSLNIKYYIKTGKIKELNHLLKRYLQEDAGVETDFADIKEFFSGHLDQLKENIEFVRLLVEILIKENDPDFAEALIRSNLDKDPVFLRLKWAHIYRLRKDRLRMFRLLKKIKGKVPEELMDEFYYLNYVYYEKVTGIKEADHYLRKIKNPLFIHLSNIKRSDQYIYEGNYEKAETILNEAVDYLKQKKYVRDEIDGRNQLAKLLREKQEISQAEKLYKNIFIKSEMKNYPLLSAYISVDLGNLYLTRDDFNQAEVWYKKALKIFQDQKNKNGMLLAQSNLVEVNKFKGNWQESRSYLKSILVHDTERKSIISMGIDYYNIAHLEYLKQNQSRAREFLQKAIELFEKKKDVSHLIECELLKSKLSFLTPRKEQRDENNTIDLSMLKKYRQRLTNDQEILLFLFDMLKEGGVPRYKHSRIREKITRIESRTLQFEIMALLIGGCDMSDLLEPLKSLSMQLSKKTRNYFYYEYYYVYFNDLLKKNEIPDEKKEIFIDVYYFFSRNKRKLSDRIKKYKIQLDEKDSIYDVFKSAELVGDYVHWKIPEDFFNSLLKEIKKRVPVDLVKLVIYEKENPIFDFFTGTKFKELTGEIVTKALHALDNLNLTTHDIKQLYKSHEKAFYFYRNTKVILWKISDTLFGVLLAAFLTDDYFDYDFHTRSRDLFKKFASLIYTYYENDFKLNRKLNWIIGESPAVKRLKEKILKVGKVDFSLLIRGESGSGKDLVARGVHLLSSRAGKPFIPVNAAAIPENLLEAELFGYKKGAFTGAAESKTGLIEAADQGTLFLDEIADLPLNLQAKLLRVLQESEIRRLGETKTIKVDFRLISATNRNLKERIKENQFREDLYFRIQDLTIDVPPLRERAEDIPLLARHFLKKYKFSIKDESELQRITAYLKGRAWTGNVRELESFIKRLITYYPDFEMEDEAPYNPRAGLMAARENLERAMISNALREHNWNKSKASDALRISRQYLTTLMQKYGIEEN